MSVRASALFYLTILLSASGLRADRSKRAVIYQVGATTTILAALAIPVDLEMPHAYVAINYAANYMNPQNASYFTQPFNRFHEKSKRDAPVDPGQISRESFYRTIVNELDKYGLNGKMCLLSTICEISSSPVDKHNGVLGSIFQMIFSPSHSYKEAALSTKFYDAEALGRKSKCEKYKAKCPLNILDLITNFQ